MSAIAPETRAMTEVDFPSLWGVKFFNDDYTPMDFVMSVLVQNFGQTHEQAQDITLLVHERGEAIVGAYPKEIADTKVGVSANQARRHGHPLRLEAVSV